MLPMEEGVTLLSLEATTLYLSVVWLKLQTQMPILSSLLDMSEGKGMG